jgi:hypothetical protein
MTDPVGPLLAIFVAMIDVCVPVFGVINKDPVAPGAVVPWAPTVSKK